MLRHNDDDNNQQNNQANQTGSVLAKNYPDDIWVAIFQRLDNKDRLKLRLLNHHMKKLSTRLADFEKQAFKNKAQFFQTLLKKDNRNREIIFNSAEFSFVADQINEIAKHLDETDVALDLPRIQSVEMELIKKEKESESFPREIVNEMCCVATLIAGLLLLFPWYIDGNQPASIANYCGSRPYGCRSGDNTGDQIDSLINLTIAAYFLLGGTAGFLLKVLEQCFLTPRILNHTLPHLLNFSSPVDSAKEAITRRVWQAIEYRDYIALALTTVITGLWNNYNFSRFNLNNYFYYDGDLLKVQRDQLEKDLRTTSNIAIGFSFSEGFLLAYSFMAVCCLIGKCVSSVAYDKNRLFKTFDKEGNRIDEKNVLINQKNPTSTYGSRL